MYFHKRPTGLSEQVARTNQLRIVRAQCSNQIFMDFVSRYFRIQFQSLGLPLQVFFHHLPHSILLPMSQNYSYLLLTWLPCPGISSLGSFSSWPGSSDQKYNVGRATPLLLHYPPSHLGPLCLKWPSRLSSRPVLSYPFFIASSSSAASLPYSSSQKNF